MYYKVYYVGRKVYFEENNILSFKETKKNIVKIAFCKILNKTIHSLEVYYGCIILFTSELGCVMLGATRVSEKYFSNFLMWR